MASSNGCAIDEQAKYLAGLARLVAMAGDLYEIVGPTSLTFPGLIDMSPSNGYAIDEQTKYLMRLALVDVIWPYGSAEQVTRLHLIKNWDDCWYVYVVFCFFVVF